MSLFNRTFFYNRYNSNENIEGIYVAENVFLVKEVFIRWNTKFIL